MQKWAYMRLTFVDGEVIDGAQQRVAREYADGERLLAKLGEEGWDLGGVAPGGDPQTYTLILKRPLLADGDLRVS